MQIDVTNHSSKGLLSVQVVHGNHEPLQWDVRTYDRTSPAEILGSEEGEKFDRIFLDINAYWAQLPKERQDALWDIYLEIHTSLTSQYDADLITRKLQTLVAKMYELMPMDEIVKWVMFKSDIRIPSNIKEMHAPEDPMEQAYIDRTYLRDDYIQLVALAVAVRPMVPIWGEYIARTKGDAGTTYKEFKAFRLMFHTHLVSSAPIERLRRYIEASVQHSQQSEPRMAAILQGIGTEELPDWTLANTVVRRAAMVPVSSPNDNSSVISDIYRFVYNTLRSFDRRFKIHVAKKSVPTGTGEEANVSKAESFKIKQPVSDGELVVMRVYTENIPRMAMAVDKTLPMELLNQCLAKIPEVEPLQVQDHQVTLVQWVMSPCQPPRGIPLLDKTSLLRCMAVTQAVLWHWGFYDLAAMVTAEPVAMARDVMIGGNEGRGRIPQELMKSLMVHFPHQYRPRIKTPTPRQTNVASAAVDRFCEMIVSTDWTLHAPPELIAKTSRPGTSKRFIVPADIRAQLAQLFIHLRQHLIPVYAQASTTSTTPTDR